MRQILSNSICVESDDGSRSSKGESSQMYRSDVRINETINECNSTRKLVYRREGATGVVRELDTPGMKSTKANGCDEDSKA